MTHVYRNFSLDVAVGNIPGAQSVHVNASKAAVGDAAFEDIWEEAGAYVFPSAASVMKVSSGSATDMGAAPLTAGTQVVDVGGTKVGGSATGLSNVAATAGTQVVDVGGAHVGGDATGLTDSDTAFYNGLFTIDGVGIHVRVVGSRAQTFTTLLAEVNAVLGSAATISLSSGNLLVTSGTTGSSSSVALSQNATDPLFSSLTGYVAINAATAGTNVVSYTATIAVDGGTPVALSIPGPSAQTYTTLLALINAALGSLATASLSSGNILFTSALIGSTSAIAITDTDLFSTLTGFVAVNAATAGTSATPSTGARSLTIEGLDANYAEVSETVILNGQTEVLTTNSFLRINSVYVASAGSGGVNVGKLYVGTGTVTAGVPATIYGSVGIGKNYMLTSVYTVPAGKTCLIYYFDFYTATAANISVRGQARVYGGVWQTRFEALFRSNTDTSEQSNFPRPMPEKTDLTFQAKAASGTADVTFLMELLNVDN